MTPAPSLRAFNIGIDTHEEPVVYMHRDCHVCRSEGFTANARLQVSAGSHTIIATLNVVESELLPADHMGLSTSAWRSLRVREGERLGIRHAPVLDSLRHLRKKIHGNTLAGGEIAGIIADISERRYADIEVASFLTACAGDRLDLNEVVALTRAMVAVGSRLIWPDYPRVYDKHCVGGLPGNRTTPIVIAIVSAAGLVIPKTSSRAITSPAGTADTMETLTSVDLSLEQMQRVVRDTGACLAWGGKVNLSPADDLLIRVEKALDMDSDGQLVASVLSKKIAAGSTHILIDIPVGPTAKVRSDEHARKLATLFEQVAAALGIEVRTVITDGRQTVGQGIGPVEEARDVLSVLANHSDAPADLAERACLLAAHLLAMARELALEDAIREARDILTSGRARTQFERICLAQGGLKELPEAVHKLALHARASGHLQATDNRRLAQLAKLAGAPRSPVAGLRLAARLGDPIAHGQTLAHLYAATRGELDYALDYYRHNRDIFTIE